MERSRQIVRVSVIGILANLVLVAFKAVVGLLTGSVAVILDAVNNLSDALSSVLTILGTRLANKPADKAHPYGYGRIENVTSVVIAVIVLLAGLTAFRESLDKIFHPAAAEYTAASLVIIAGAVLVKFFLGRYVKAQGEKYHSDSLTASGSDALFDAVISLTTLLAAAVSLLWGWSVEGYLGVVIAIVILKAGLEILLESLGALIGARVDSETAVQMKERVNAYDAVQGVYDLILHRYGPEKNIGSLHIQVADDMTAREIHALTRQITQDIFCEFGVILTVGIYAANTGSARSAAIYEDVSALVEAYPEVLQLHGFYVDEAAGQVSFDLIVAFGGDAETIRREIVEKLSAAHPDYRFDVILDSDFSD